MGSFYVFKLGRSIPGCACPARGGLSQPPFGGSSQGCLRLRASNEGLRRPRVARAQKIISLHPSLCSASKEGTWPPPLIPFQTSAPKTPSSFPYAPRYPSANVWLPPANHPWRSRRGGRGGRTCLIRAAAGRGFWRFPAPCIAPSALARFSEHTQPVPGVF